MEKSRREKLIRIFSEDPSVLPVSEVKYLKFSIIKEETQLESQIAKSLVRFVFSERGRGVLSNPKELTSLHTHQDVTMEKEEAVVHITQEDIRSCPGTEEWRISQEEED
jgi:hypothetical protein